MSIYPNVTYQEGADDGVPILFKITEVPGLKTVDRYVLADRTEERSDCFCCTCDESEDPACRNHGYYGRRPCEAHGMPGYEWEDTNEMPESVQEIRRRNA